MLVQISQQPLQKPDWIRVRLPTTEQFSRLKTMLRRASLHTVCEEAACPNIYECFSQGVATFMIMGDVCTRHCLYCHVKSGKPHYFDDNEPRKVAESVRHLGLHYTVITSVTRDDLPDGGATWFARTIQQVKEKSSCIVEVLVPDFQYSPDSLKTVVAASPDVFSHNIETVQRVYPHVRPRGDFKKSLQLLKDIKKINPAMHTKSGFMLGLGEAHEEIVELLHQLRDVGCDFLSVGQYLQPSPKHVKVQKFYTPEEFFQIQKRAYQLGFKHVEAGPLVRSSYRADKLKEKL